MRFLNLLSLIIFISSTGSSADQVKLTPNPAYAEAEKMRLKKRRDITESQIDNLNLSSIIKLTDLIKPNVIGNSEVIILGETHHQYGQAKQPLILHAIHQIAPEKYNCLFMEYAPHKEKDNLHYALKGISEHKSLAKALGIKIRFIDTMQTISLINKNSTDLALDRSYRSNIQLRNLDIATNIAKYLNNKECNGGVLIVGKAHVARSFNHQTLIPIQKILQERLNKKTYVINLVEDKFKNSNQIRANDRDFYSYLFKVISNDMFALITPKNTICGATLNMEHGSLCDVNAHIFMKEPLN